MNQVQKIVNEIHEVGGLLIRPRKVIDDYRDGIYSSNDVLSYNDLPLISKHRLYMAYLEDAEETPLSYLDVEQHYVCWNTMRPEAYFDGDIYKVRANYDRLMFFLKPQLDDVVSEAFDDAVEDIVAREAGTRIFGGSYQVEGVNY